MRAIGGDPGAVIASIVNDVRCATADTKVRRGCARAGDGRDGDLGSTKGLVHGNYESSCVERASGAHVHISIATAKHDGKTGFGQGSIYGAMQ